MGCEFKSHPRQTRAKYGGGAKAAAFVNIRACNRACPTFGDAFTSNSRPVALWLKNGYS